MIGQRLGDLSNGCYAGLLTLGGRGCQRGGLMERREPVCGSRRLGFGPRLSFIQSFKDSLDKYLSIQERIKNRKGNGYKCTTPSGSTWIKGWERKEKEAWEEG